LRRSVRINTRLVRFLRKCTALCCVCAASLVLAFSCSNPAPRALAFTHVTLIDATGAPPRRDTTVVVSNGRISRIGPASTLSVPAGAQAVDGTGKFLIPALADMHVHLTGAGEPQGSREFMIPLLLANGIATVRDMGGYLESLVPLREEIAKEKRLGPDIVFAGPYLDGNPPSFQPSLVVNDANDADRDVADLIAHGVDFIKVQSMLSRDAYFAISAACRRDHITFVGHVPDRVTAAEASDAGQHSIEHLTGVLRACSSIEPRLMREQFYVPRHKQTPADSETRLLRWQQQLLKTQSDRFTAALLEEFLHNGTWQVPTLITLRNVAFPTPPDTAQPDLMRDSRVLYVPRQFLEAWRRQRAKELQVNPPQLAAERFANHRALLQRSLAVVGKMNGLGIPIMAGTDSAAPFVFPGSSLHEELSLLVDAGLSPMQALQAATKKAAEFLGRSAEQGTAEPGRVANLLLLDGNPLDDIHNTERIRAFVLRGKLLERSDLDHLLAGVREFAASH
jgi:imidazolonepropionase-like amidohydrolase